MPAMAMVMAAGHRWRNDHVRSPGLFRAGATSTVRRAYDAVSGRWPGVYLELLGTRCTGPGLERSQISRLHARYNLSRNWGDHAAHRGIRPGRRPSLWRDR